MSLDTIGVLQNISLLLRIGKDEMKEKVIVVYSCAGIYFHSWNQNWNSRNIE